MRWGESFRGWYYRDELFTITGDNMFERIGSVITPLGEMAVEGDWEYGVIQFTKASITGGVDYNITYVRGDRVKLIESTITDLGFTVILDKSSFESLYNSFNQDCEETK